VNRKEESMDNFLKAHLAALRTNEYNTRTEREIIEALQRGNTFFFYSLKDIQNELNVTLSFAASPNPYGSAVPKLDLHYSSIAGMQALSDYEERKKKKILPNRQ
jgi:hypothetical protein